MKNVFFVASVYLVVFLVGCDSSKTHYETLDVNYANELERGSVSISDYESQEMGYKNDVSVLDDEIAKESLDAVDSDGAHTYSEEALSYTPPVNTLPIATYAHNLSYHTDDAYQYEYRTGVSGNYQYNYDVSGSDDYGDSVSGNLDMQGRYGSGYVMNADGEQVEVEAEWTDYGEIEATDYEGNRYELTVD